MGNGDPCGLHEKYEKWQDERWADQRKTNECLFDLCRNLSTSVNELKNRISYAAGAMAVVIILAPFLWKLISSILGIKV